jgi:hypothetical protein
MSETEVETERGTVTEELFEESSLTDEYDKWYKATYFDDVGEDDVIYVPVDEVYDFSRNTMNTEDSMMIEYEDEYKIHVSGGNPTSYFYFNKIEVVTSEDVPEQ